MTAARLEQRGTQKEIIIRQKQKITLIRQENERLKTLLRQTGIEI